MHSHYTKYPLQKLDPDSHLKQEICKINAYKTKILKYSMMGLYCLNTYRSVKERQEMTNASQTKVL